MKALTSLDARRLTYYLTHLKIMTQESEAQRQRRRGRFSSESSWRLRQSEAIKSPLLSIWAALLATERRSDVQGEDQLISFSTYTELWNRVYTVLFEEWEPANAEVLIMRDYSDDCANSDTASAGKVDKETLGDGLYEVSDLFCAKAEENELCDFLFGLLERVARRPVETDGSSGSRSTTPAVKLTHSSRPMSGGKNSRAGSSSKGGGVSSGGKPPGGPGSSGVGVTDEGERAQGGVHAWRPMEEVVYDSGFHTRHHAKNTMRWLHRKKHGGSSGELVSPLGGDVADEAADEVAAEASGVAAAGRENASDASRDMLGVLLQQPQPHMEAPAEAPQPPQNRRQRILRMIHRHTSTVIIQAMCRGRLARVAMRELRRPGGRSGYSPFQRHRYDRSLSPERASNAGGEWPGSITTQGSGSDMAQPLTSSAAAVPLAVHIPVIIPDSVRIPIPRPNPRPSSSPSQRLLLRGSADNEPASYIDATYGELQRATTYADLRGALMPVRRLAPSLSTPQLVSRPGSGSPADGTSGSKRNDRGELAAAAVAAAAAKAAAAASTALTVTRLQPFTFQRHQLPPEARRVKTTHGMPLKPSAFTSWVARLDIEQQKLEKRGISLLAYDAVTPPKMRTPARLRGRRPVSAGAGVRSASIGPPPPAMAPPQAILPPWRPGQSSKPTGMVEPAGWQEEPHHDLVPPSHKERADAKTAALQSTDTTLQRAERTLAAPLTSGGCGSGAPVGGVSGGGDGAGGGAGGGYEHRAPPGVAGSGSRQGPPEISKRICRDRGAAAALEASQTTERRLMVQLQRPNSAAQVAKGKSNVTAMRIARLSSPAPIFHLGQPGLSNCILLGDEPT